MSTLFRSSAHPTWVKQGSPGLPQTAAREWRRILDTYQDPGIDDSLDQALREYVDRRTRECEA